VSEYHFSIPGHEIREQVLIFTRAHPVSFFGRVVFLTSLFLFPFLIIPLALQVVMPQVAILVACSYYLLWFDIAFIEWVKFYYDFLIVTESQIIAVEQKGIFERAIYQCHITQVEESTARIQGLLPNLFSYGAINLQTAGPQEHIVIRNIPNPFEISERIMKLHNEMLGRR